VTETAPGVFSVIGKSDASDWMDTGVHNKATDPASESVTLPITLPAGRTYYVRVYGVGGAVNAKYDLGITWQ
jgi:hypothetical protein